MESTVNIRGCYRKISVFLATSVFLMALGSANYGARAIAQTPAHRQTVPSECVVIQGRITAMQGAFVTVKTPDGYPGGPGIHAQVIVAGPALKIDVSRARVLLPDGKHNDPQPLAVGNRVLIVLRGPVAAPAPNGPGNVIQTYVASSIERIAESDKIVTH